MAIARKHCPRRCQEHEFIQFTTLGRKGSNVIIEPTNSEELTVKEF